MTDFTEEDETIQLRSVLNEIGLNEYEKVAYLMVLQLGVTVAKEISDYTKIPYAKVYQVLESLIDKGLILRDEGRPKKFHLKQPSIAFHDLLKKLETDWISEHNRREHMIKEKMDIFQKFYDSKKLYVEEEEGVWTITGITNILYRIDLLVKRVESRILIISENAHPIISKIFEILDRENQKSAIKVEIITSSDKSVFQEFSASIFYSDHLGDAILIFFDDFANFSVISNESQRYSETIGVLTQIKKIVQSLLLLVDTKVLEVNE